MSFTCSFVSRAGWKGKSNGELWVWTKKGRGLAEETIGSSIMHSSPWTGMQKFY